MKILVKFPTRDRPIRFFETLDLYYSMADDIDNMYFFISCDIDDDSMNNKNIINKFKEYENLSVKYGSNKNKIEAVNSDINEIIGGYDIILLASDDMLPRVKGYDNIIRNKMIEKYPDLDGVLWFNDGLKGELLNTLSIMGVEYFKRFGYIYHPSYKSFYCDDEFTEVSKQLGKCSYFDDIIIEHVHHVKYEEVDDDLYILNRKYYPEDEKNYKHRRSFFVKNFR